jgi:hypothetical protein
MIKITAVTHIIILLLVTAPAFGQPNCVDSEGDAVVINNDIPSAKNEAIARAKWNAIEQVTGVEVRSQSVVQNMALVDDAISKQIKGVVTSFKIFSQENRQDTYFVRINACVEPTSARDALSSLALNNSIAVFIPAKKPKLFNETVQTRKSRQSTSGRQLLESVDEHDETNLLSEGLIGKLAEQGFTVVDIAPTHVVDAAEIDKSLKSGNYLALRSLMYKFLANLLLIGKVEYTIATKKGEDVGYGISTPFNSVTVRLTYRLVTREKESGKMIIVAAGTHEAKGLAANIEDAVAKGMNNLADKFAPLLLDKVSKHIKGIGRKINVEFTGISDISANFALKESLQQIAWVTNVEEQGLGQFIVSYPENTIYLANSIVQKGNMKLLNFSPYSIKFERN